MKRADIKVGVEYARQSPSQRGKENNRWGGSSAKKVLVVSTDPVYYGSYDDYRYSYRRQTDSSGFVIVEGQRIEYAYDYSSRLPEDAKDDHYRRPEAKRNVLAIEFGHYGGNILTTVPMSNISMTWAEFEAIVAAAKASAEAADARARRESQERARVGATIRAIETTKDVTQARLDGYRGQVTLSYAAYLDLLERVES